MNLIKVLERSAVRRSIENPSDVLRTRRKPARVTKVDSNGKQACRGGKEWEQEEAAEQDSYTWKCLYFALTVC